MESLLRWFWIADTFCWGGKVSGRKTCRRHQAWEGCKATEEVREVQCEVLTVEELWPGSGSGYPVPPIRIRAQLRSIPPPRTDRHALNFLKLLFASCRCRRGGTGSCRVLLCRPGPVRQGFGSGERRRGSEPADMRGKSLRG